MSDEKKEKEKKKKKEREELIKEEVREAPTSGEEKEPKTPE